MIYRSGGTEKQAQRKGESQLNILLPNSMNLDLRISKSRRFPQCFLNTDICSLNIDGDDFECFAGNGTNRKAETGIF